MFERLDAYFRGCVTLAYMRFRKIINTDEKLIEIGNEFKMEANRLIMEESIDKLTIKLRYWSLAHQGEIDELMIRVLVALEYNLTFEDCCRALKDKN